MNLYEAVIGLEVHCQLQTKSKAFCFAPLNDSGNTNPNSFVRFTSAGLPGSLPVLNKRSVELGIRAGIALNCKINSSSQFSRKNYFYPDLPKGYQISQGDKPLCSNGYVDVRDTNSKIKRIRIQRIHIEEDAGKLSHIGQNTLIDLNRAGVTLIEIVSEPDLSNPKEAGEYLRLLHETLVFAGVTDGNLEAGNFRCDANVSVRKVGAEKLGTRAELKNINSFKFVEAAIDYEIARQISTLEAGGRIIQETRGWDSSAAKTYSMRSKEEAQDYRYFPDPDLAELKLTQEEINRIRDEIPELPQQKRQKYQDKFKLNFQEIEFLTSKKEYASYFENLVALGASPKSASSWLGTEIIGLLKEKECDFNENPISEKRVFELIKLIEQGVISGKLAKKVLIELFQTQKTAHEIVTEKGWIQISDKVQLETWINSVIVSNPSQVQEFRDGKEKVFAFFIGEVMKLSQGKAHPEILSQLLREKLLTK